MQWIEDKIKSLEPNKCRGCSHYIRVNSDGIRNVMNRRGFCILGQLEGDYGLYCSSSISRECMGFVFSENNYNIMQAERKLDQDEDKYLESLRDKRTTNYKEIEPLLKAGQNYLEKTEKLPKGLAWMNAEMQIRRVACDHFMEMNKERYHQVYDMVSLKKSDYLKFLAQVSVQIHDRFCECQCIEFKIKKEV